MSKPKITLDIIKEDVGYSAMTNIAGKFIGTQADSLDDLKSNILEAVNLAFSEDGFHYSIAEIELRYLEEKAGNSLH
jgi:hypothetical protein